MEISIKKIPGKNFVWFLRDLWRSRSKKIVFRDVISSFPCSCRCQIFRFFAQQFNVLQHRCPYKISSLNFIGAMDGRWFAKQFNVLQRRFQYKRLDCFYLDTMDVVSCLLVLCISLASVMLVVFFNLQVCLVKLVEEHPWDLNDSMFELVWPWDDCDHSFHSWRGFD